MTLRLAWHIFSLELRNILNYRVDFWVNWLAGTAAHLGVAWFLWDAIFSYTGKTDIAGFSQKSMMLYYTLAILMDRAVQGLGKNFISDDIYEGTLNRFLVYPVPLFRYKLVENWAHVLFSASQGLLLYLAFALILGLPQGAEFDAAFMALGLFSLFAGAALYLGMVMIVEQVAFWADNVWSLNVMMSLALRLLGGTLVPLALFPDTAREILNWLPFATLVSLPIRTMMGQVTFNEWLAGMALMAGWMAVAWTIALMVWKRGMLKYSGVGI